MMRAGLLLALLVGGGWWQALQRVHDSNAAQRAAAAAYARQDYVAAAQAYERALQLGNNSAELQLNLGHASARAGRVAEARRAYGQVVQSPDAALRSVARQQLAGLVAAQGNYAQAITLLRQALVDNPSNAVARYNYELLRPYQGRPAPLPPPPPPAASPKPSQGGNAQKKPAQNGQSQASASSQGTGPDRGGQNTPGTNGTPTPTAQGSGPGEARGFDAGASGTGPAGTGKTASDQAATGADNRVITRQAQSPANLTEAQARQVLETLQAAEQQYLQQIPYRATRPGNPRKPAW